MFIKRKGSRPTRERLLDDDEEPSDLTSAPGSPGAPTSPLTLAAKLKNKTRIKAKSRLSFGGDDVRGIPECYMNESEFTKIFA